MKPVISFLKPALFGLAALFSLSTPAHAWWNNEWTQRKALTVAPAATAAAETLGSTPVLVRLHIGNFDFQSAREDGADLRFVAADDKTPFAYHIEKYDSLLGEAFVWVKVPGVKTGEPARFWLYYGNPAAPAVGDAAGTYDAATTLVYHFGEAGQPARDHSPAGNHAETAGLAIEGSLIGTGLHLNGTAQVRIPGTTAFAWPAGAPLTWSAWIRATNLQGNTVLFSRRDGAAAFIVGADKGVPYIAITTDSGVRRSAGGAPLTAGRWQHLAVVGTAAETTLYLDGVVYATLGNGLPGLTGPAILGGDTVAGATGFVGEVDEVQIAKAARSAGLVTFAFASQGGTEAVLTVGDAEHLGGGEGGALGEAAQHLFLFGDIARNMMFDGWIAVFVCLIMIVIGWTVAIQKLAYLNKIQKGSDLFIQQWREVSADLTVLDHNNTESVKSMGGTAVGKAQVLLQGSPLYQLYHIGSEEIRHRLLRKGGFTGLSARSIQAIKASLDSGLTHEMHKLNKGLVYLTISIAGGPYVGLLGTVVGVMITFAVIAKTGQVEVNSIAPGIASALLATVAGLLVAIPALFVYSYLNTRIKNMNSNMRMFIDEFIATMAEFYPSKGDMQRAAAADEKEHV